MIKKLFYSLYTANAKIITSQLTYSEVLTAPISTNSTRLLEKYEDFLLGSNAIASLEIDLEVLRRTSYIRALNKKLKTPDAIHVATALKNSCDFFITNDERIQIPNNLPLKRVLLNEV